jgi:hypothetical protein
MKKIIHSVTFRFPSSVHLSAIIGITLWLIFLFCSMSAQAQWSITAQNTNFTQDFNSMGSAAGTIPGGFKAALGNDHSFNGTTTDEATTSYPSNLQGRCYNFGYPQNSSDRSLGFINSNSYSSPRSITSQIVNNTGATIDTIKLSWKYEKYRSGNRQWDWNFFYGPSSSPSTNYPQGNQSYPSDGNNTTAYTPPLTVNKSVTLANLNIPAGASYYFMWTLTGLGGSTNGMALSIDDVTINCKSSAPACPPGTPVVNLGNDMAYCTGSPFSYTINAQNTGSTYDWNNGTASSQTLVANQAGTYTVKVTDANGCIGRDTLIITENPLPQVHIGNDTAYCAGLAFTLELDAENPGAIHNWNNGAANTQTYMATQAGTYSVSVTDANGCIGSDQLIVTENQLPTVDLGNDTAYCTGSPFALELDAENPGTLHNWNNGAANTQTYMATQAGTYSVSVTDANGCVGSDQLIVTENQLPTVDLGNDTAYCAGSPFELELDAQNPGTLHNWNNGAANTQTYMATQAGTYSVSVTDANGCVGSDQLVVTEHILPPLNLGNDTAYCPGSPFLWLLDATHPGSTYSWNGGMFSAPIFVVTQTGSYSVMVTDANGCSVSDSVLVNEYALPNVNLGNDTSYCSGSSFSLLLNVGNTGSTYVWGNGSITPTVTATQAGLYSVTVTSPNGCINRDSLLVSEIAPPNINLGNDVSVAGNSHVLNAGGGFMDYLWLPGNQTSQQITVTQNGTYIVFVTNSGGCRASDTVLVTLGTASIQEEYTKSTIHIFPNPSTGIFQLNLTESGTFQLDVIAISGQLVFSQQIVAISETPIPIDLSHLSNGVYNLRLSNPKSFNSQKIIINQ